MNGPSRIALLGLAAGVAQLSGVRIEQQNQGSGPASEQVAAPQVAPRAGPPATAASQVSAAERPGPVSQVGPAGAGGDAPVQLSSSAASTTDAPSISRADRVVEPPRVVGGRDRCQAEGADADPACANVLERRAAEFARPDPNRLTPEQRLLIERRIRDQPASVDAAVRRAGRDDLDPDNLSAQTLAAVANEARTDPRAGQPATGANPVTGLESLGDAIEAAVIGVGGQLPVRPQR